MLLEKMAPMDLLNTGEPATALQFVKKKKCSISKCSQAVCLYVLLPQSVLNRCAHRAGFAECVSDRDHVIHTDIS